MAEREESVMEGRSRNRLIRMARPRRTGSIVVATRSWAALVQVVARGVLLVAFPTRCVGFSSSWRPRFSPSRSLPPVRALVRRRLLRPAAVTLTPFVGFLPRPRSSSTPSFNGSWRGCPVWSAKSPTWSRISGRLLPIGRGTGVPAAAGVRAWWDANGATLIGEPTSRLAKGFLVTGSAVVTVVFLALFLLLSGPEWFRGFLERCPRVAVPSCRLGDGVTKAVGGYVLGNLLISLHCGTVATVVLLVMRVPYALPLGLVVAVFDLIPMVGATLALVVAALVALTQGIGTCAVVVGALVIYQLVENSILAQAVYHGTVASSLITIAASASRSASSWAEWRSPHGHPHRRRDQGRARGGARMAARLRHSIRVMIGQLL